MMLYEMQVMKAELRATMLVRNIVEVQSDS